MGVTRPTTLYFRHVVLPRRGYLTLDLVERAIGLATARQVQADGRIRLWARPSELDGKWLRIVLLEDGYTIHNAFLDRDGPPRGEPAT